MKEREGIQRQCLDLLLSLREKGYPVHPIRTNSGKIRTDQGYYIQLCEEGTPDITACINGKYYGVECKTDKGRLKEAQIIGMHRILNAGGNYVVADNIEVLIAVIEKELGINVREIYKKKG